MKLHGIFAKPYLPLPEVVEGADLREIDREVTLGLSNVTLGQTGATLKWMGIVAPWQMDDGYRDAMDAISSMSNEEFLDFAALTDSPNDVSPDDRGAFGDETDRPFSLEQIRLLTVRHGVYFPWKACYHLLDNHLWDDKHSGEGKSWNEDARLHFPKTIALIEQLPFREIGRVVIFGILPNDHAPLHRDSEPGKDLSIAQFITIDPRQNKGLYLQNAAEDEKVVVDASAYWFNDMDYHGVLSAPYFRYSIRIDGVFEPSFVRDLERRHRGSRAAPIPSSA